MDSHAAARLPNGFLPVGRQPVGLLVNKLHTLNVITMNTQDDHIFIYGNNILATFIS